MGKRFAWVGAVAAAALLAGCGSGGGGHRAAPPPVPPPPPVSAAASPSGPTPQEIEAGLRAYLPTARFYGARVLGVNVLPESTRPGVYDIRVATDIPAHTEEAPGVGDTAQERYDNDARFLLGDDVESWLRAHPGLSVGAVDVMDAARSGKTPGVPVPLVEPSLSKEEADANFERSKHFIVDYARPLNRWVSTQRIDVLTQAIADHYYPGEGWYLTFGSRLPARGADVPADAVRTTPDGLALAQRLVDWIHANPPPADLTILRIQVMDANHAIVAELPVTP